MIEKPAQTLLFIFALLGNYFLVDSLAAEDNFLDGISLDASVTRYFLPGQEDITVPIIGLSYEKLYLESRHNYEAKDVYSTWIGRTFSFGDSLQVELTPLIGGLYGIVHGMAPGFEADLTYHDFNLYSEAEYVFDFAGRENNFFYSWSELSYYPLDWLRVGIAGQRTRLYSSSVDIDRGPLVGIEMFGFSFTATALNLDSNPIWTMELSCGLPASDDS